MFFLLYFFKRIRFITRAIFMLLGVIVVIGCFNTPVLAQQGNDPTPIATEVPPESQPGVEPLQSEFDEVADVPVGDVNKDRRVDILDLTYIAARYGTNDLSADINGDGQVNIFDLVAAAKNYGQQGR